MFVYLAVDLYDKGESLLISKPKNGVFSSLSISTLCKVAHKCTVCRLMVRFAVRGSGLS